MNLHRTSGAPDWDRIDPSSYNFFQKIAASTRGIVTLANIISLVGLIIVGWGLLVILNDHTWLGIGLVAAGRLMDIADGAVAEATKTKSPLGEIVDAAFDKIGTLLTIIVLFAIHVAPWWVIVALLIPQAIIPVVIFYKKQKGIGIHPTHTGKLSMAMAWVGIVGLLMMKAIESSSALTVGVYALISVSLLLGLYALWQYVNETKLDLS